MIKKISMWFLWVLSIWYLIISAVNYKCMLSWKLFVYDLFSGFRDNRVYMAEVFLPVTTLAITISILFLLLLESPLIMYWDVRIRGYHFRIGDLSFVRRHKRQLMGLSYIGAAVLFAFVSCRQLPEKAEGIFDLTPPPQMKTIAHAGGAIDGNDYTNSLEAILLNYSSGHRVFEIDFSVTSDNQLICKHGWKNVLQEGAVSGEPMSSQAFMNTPILGQYTPLSFETLCQLMDKYPDLWIVTDTKDTEVEAVQRDFELLIDTAKACGMESVLDRMIVQIYSEEMYDTVSHIYPFKSWIYTLYKFWLGDKETFQACIRFCYENDIDGITTWNYYVTPELMQIANAYDIPWYAHTENDVENAKAMISLGLAGIYTDNITPDMLKQ